MAITHKGLLNNRDQSPFWWRQTNPLFGSRDGFPNQWHPFSPFSTASRGQAFPVAAASHAASSRRQWPMVRGKRNDEIVQLHKRGMLKKAASGVLALLPDLRARRLGALRRSRSRTESTLRGSKRLRPCWTNPSVRLRPCFFEHSLSLLWVVFFSDASTGSDPELFNRPLQQ